MHTNKVVNIFKMLNYMSEFGASPDLILLLNRAYDCSHFTTMEYECLCNLLLIPMRYRLNHSATESKICEYMEKINENVVSRRNFTMQCSRVKTLLHCIYNDTSAYYWHLDNPVSFNIMVKILYDVAVKNMYYESAVIDALVFAGEKHQNVIPINFLYDFFNTYVFVEVNGDMFTPYKLMHDYRSSVRIKTRFKVFAQSKKDKALPIYTEMDIIGYIPWVQSAKKAVVRISTKNVKNAVNVECAENEKQNDKKCTLKHFLDTSNAVFVEYDVYAAKIKGKLRSRSDVAQFGLQDDAVITAIVEHTQDGSMRRKPTDELYRYLMIRNNGSRAASVWHALNGFAIKRKHVTDNVDIMKYVYFTDELYNVFVSRDNCKYIHISELEMYMLENTEKIKHRLDALKFFVKIEEYYFEVPACELARDYKDEIIRLVAEKQSIQ